MATITRRAFLICNEQEQFLVELTTKKSGASAIGWSKDFSRARDAGFYWLSQAEAFMRLHQFKQLHPGVNAGIASVQLKADTSNPLGWELVKASFSLPITA